MSVRSALPFPFRDGLMSHGGRQGLIVCSIISVNLTLTNP
jgi:hypothetical protein